MSTRPSLLSAVALAALLIGTATPSLAQNTNEKFEEGVAAYEDGKFERAAEIWEPLAKEGDPEALRNLAQLYRLGLGVEKDDRRAYRLYREAAEKNSVEAQVNTAFLLLIGEGVKKSPEDAAIWFAKAADQGDAMAQFNLGLMYEKGVGVQPDAEIARELYQLAANQGQERALDRLDSLESELPPDGGANARKEADERRDAEQRDEERQKAEVKRARERASEQRARERGEDETKPEEKPDAKSTMPIMSIKRSTPDTAGAADKDKGKDAAEPGAKMAARVPTTKPERAAVEKKPVVRKPAQQKSAALNFSADSPVSRIKLAENAYKKGDFSSALSIIKPLSDQGMPIAQFWMGRMLNRGEGVKLDRFEAYSLWRSAAASGSSRAATALANLSNRFTPEELARAEQHHAKMGRAR